ncbi:MAG: hypothetical protein AAB267_01310 [Candidatus Desantisbacteria bacterium]
MVKVPLYLVDVDEKDFTPELYENFSNMPLDIQKWLMENAFKRNKILSTMKGEKQSRFYLLMDVNLDPMTWASGRGGILMDAETNEPIIVTTNEGAEQVVMLKASGPYQAMETKDLAVDTSRVVQGGRIEHDVFTFRKTGKELGLIEMYYGKIVIFPIGEYIVYIREGKVDNVKKGNDFIQFKTETNSEQSFVIIKRQDDGSVIGVVKMEDGTITECTLNGGYRVFTEDGRISKISDVEGKDVLGDFEISHSKQTRTSKTRMGQILGHTREASPREILKKEGTETYERGQCARAILRLNFTYSGNQDYQLQQLWRSVPSTRRIGWMMYGDNEKYNIEKMARTMGWNDAEILCQDQACVHIAPNPDNIYSTGYYTDEDSQIPLYLERDPKGAFLYYFGYYMQLMYWDFKGAKEEADRSTIELTTDFATWVNAFLDHFLEINYGGQRLIRNPDRFKDFRARAALVSMANLEQFERDFMDAIWEEYLAHHVLMNRFEYGYDPKLESTYSGGKKQYEYDPKDKGKAIAFIANQRAVLKAAEQLIKEQGYGKLYSKLEPFSFEAAYKELDSKEKLIGQLSNLPPRENHYADIYNLSFYPALKPNVFSVLDWKGIKSGHKRLRYVLTQAMPTLLKEKAGVLARKGAASSTETRVRDLFYEGLDRFPQWGEFTLVPVYFNCFFTRQGPAEITTMDKPEDVYYLLQSDYQATSQTFSKLASMDKIVFQEHPVMKDGKMYFLYKYVGLNPRTVYVMVDMNRNEVLSIDEETFIRETADVTQPGPAIEGHPIPVLGAEEHAILTAL